MFREIDGDNEIENILSKLNIPKDEWDDIDEIEIKMDDKIEIKMYLKKIRCGKSPLAIGFNTQEQAF